jgi:hypothetical protein
MTFELTGWMLYAMWAVLGVMGLDFLVGLVKSLNSSSSMVSMVMGYLKDMLTYILPLFVVYNLMSLDPTGIVMMVFFYLCALGLFVKYIYDLKGRL